MFFSLITTWNQIYGNNYQIFICEFYELCRLYKCMSINVAIANKSRAKRGFCEFNSTHYILFVSIYFFVVSQKWSKKIWLIPRNAIRISFHNSIQNCFVEHIVFIIISMFCYYLKGGVFGSS